MSSSYGYVALIMNRYVIFFQKEKKRHSHACCVHTYADAFATFR